MASGTIMHQSLTQLTSAFKRRSYGNQIIGTIPFFGMTLRVEKIPICFLLTRIEARSTLVKDSD